MRLMIRNRTLFRSLYGSALVSGNVVGLNVEDLPQFSCVCGERLVTAGNVGNGIVPYPDTNQESVEMFCRQEVTYLSTNGGQGFPDKRISTLETGECKAE